MQRIFRTVYKRNLIFQQNGCPSSLGTNIRSLLDTTYQMDLTRWLSAFECLSNARPKTPSPRALQTSLHCIFFFFWSYINDKVYSRDPRYWRLACLNKSCYCYSEHYCNWTTGWLYSKLLCEPTWKFTDFSIKALSTVILFYIL